GEVAPAGPAPGLHLDDLRERHGILLSLGNKLVAVDEGTSLKVGDVADLGAVVGTGGEAADLEDELRVAVVNDGDLGVGRLALVLVAEAAAHADDRLRIGRAGSSRGGDEPAGDVHLVDALVANVAVAEIPEPVPVVVDEVPVEGLFRRGPEPEVEIEVGRG